MRPKAYQVPKVEEGPQVCTATAQTFAGREARCPHSIFGPFWRCSQWSLLMISEVPSGLLSCSNLTWGMGAILQLTVPQISPGQVESAPATGSPMWHTQERRGSQGSCAGLQGPRVCRPPNLPGSAVPRGLLLCPAPSSECSVTTKPRLSSSLVEIFAFKSLTLFSL